jgi:hypothetical protein
MRHRSIAPGHGRWQSWSGPGGYAADLPDWTALSAVVTGLGPAARQSPRWIATAALAVAGDGLWPAGGHDAARLIPATAVVLRTGTSLQYGSPIDGWPDGPQREQTLNLSRQCIIRFALSAGGADV